MIDLSQLFLIQTLKTGIFSLDIIIIFIFLIFQNYSHILNLLQKLLNIDRVSKVVQKIHNRIMYKNTLLYTGIEYKSCGYSVKIAIEYPDQVLATIDYIVSSSNAQKYNLQYIEQYERTSGLTNKFYMPLSNYPIEIEKDLFFMKEKTFKEYSTNECKGEYTDVKFIFFSSKKTSNEMKGIIDGFLDIYKAKIDEKLAKNIYYFTYGNNLAIKPKRYGEDEPDKLYWTEYILKTNRTFDNVFFKQKALILSRLKFFMENQEWYNKRGIPYTLGFLFKGPPGCGKTSTIKAISNYTKRHVFEIRLSEIKNINELHNIFFSETINEKTIPISKRLYVFEELDCILDTIKKRATTVKSEMGEISAYNELLKKCGSTTTKADGIPASQIAEMIPKILPESIDIGQLLSLFDGVLESPGRMMIFTTNHADKIDDALKRPGRIDEEIEFSLCDAEMIRYIIELFYEHKIPETITFEKYANQFSPAEITKLCFNNDYDKLLDTVLTA